MQLFTFFFILSSLNAFALEVIKFEHKSKLELKIIRAEPESFETYSLINHNGREMILVCANNRVYDDNKKAFIEYRNFYNEIAGNFELESNQVCLDIGKFIESAAAGVSEEKPFLITLNTKNLKVEKVEFPKIDPFADEGDVKDLLPRSIIVKEKPVKKGLLY